VKPLVRWPIYVLALPAFVGVWSGWVMIGALTGFGVVHPLPGTPLASWRLDTAILLPVGVETYAAYALYVWLSGRASRRAERFAKISSIGALALGAVGQAVSHVMVSAGVHEAPWGVTAAVSTLPVIVLGLAASLGHITVTDARVTAESSPETIVRPIMTASEPPRSALLQSVEGDWPTLILSAVDEPATLAEIVRKLDRPRNSVDYQVKKLQAAGVLHVADGRYSQNGVRLPS
jgi:hypothetical protein